MDVTLVNEPPVMGEKASSNMTLDAFLEEFRADPLIRVFSDEGTEDGHPIGAHPGFVDVEFSLFEDRFECGDTSAWNTTSSALTATFDLQP